MCRRSNPAESTGGTNRPSFARKTLLRRAERRFIQTVLHTASVRANLFTGQNVLRGVTARGRLFTRNIRGIRFHSNAGTRFSAALPTLR